MIKNALKTELAQKTLISQQTIKLMKMIELSSIDIQQKIDDEIIENPALEVDVDDHNEKEEELENRLDEIFSTFVPEDVWEDNQPNYKTKLPAQNNDFYSYEGEYKASYRENLLSQIHEFELTKTQETVAQYIIGSLDEKGYLRDDIAQLATDFLLDNHLEISPVEIEKVLQNIIQKLDPPGVGARSLQESLLLQIERMEASDNQKLASEVLKTYFEEYSKKHFDKIINKLKIDNDQWDQVNAIILKLKPFPVFSATQDDEISSIIPDFTVTVENDVIEILPNYQLSKLRVNKNYSQFSKNSSKETTKFIKENIDKATLFINNVETRESVLGNAIAAIVHFQRTFFITGDFNDIKPMILKDIADKVGYDISTISRVVKDRYVQTSYGAQSLRALFSESVGSEEISSITIKNKIKEMVEQEEKNKPLSDDKIAQNLEKMGFPTARRTVAKYREQLGIPVARLRK